MQRSTSTRSVEQRQKAAQDLRHRLLQVTGLLPSSSAPSNAPDTCARCTEPAHGTVVSAAGHDHDRTAPLQGTRSDRDVRAEALGLVVEDPDVDAVTAWCITDAEAARAALPSLRARRRVPSPLLDWLVTSRAHPPGHSIRTVPLLMRLILGRAVDFTNRRIGERTNGVDPDDPALAGCRDWRDPHWLDTVEQTTTRSRRAGHQWPRRARRRPST